MRRAAETHSARDDARPVAARGSRERLAAATACAVIVAATWLVFAPALEYGFVNYDDDEYVYDNRAVRGGITADAVAWAFTHTHSNNWHPLTWLSHALDCQLWGLSAGGHHLTNLVLHAAGAVALFLVLWRATAAPWRSAVVALVFTVHPLRVESVAWISERKDVLSGVCFALVLGAYVRHVRHPAARRWTLAVAALFALGLMAKPMLVTVPAVLLLLDYWPLRRFGTPDGGRLVPPPALLREKLPLLALAAGSVVVTLVAQRHAIQPLDAVPLGARLANAATSTVAYLGDLLYPTGLAVFRPFRAPAPLAVLLAVGLLGALTAIAWRLRRERPYLLVGWLWYLVMLTPVVGVVQIGTQARADRYTYLPQIGLVLACTWAVADAVRGSRPGRVVAGAAAAGVIAALAAAARAQVAHWRDSEALWVQALAHTTGNGVAHANLGAALLDAGRVDEAAVHLEAALALHPAYRQALVDLGNARLRTGRIDDALALYRRARSADPASANAALGLGNALQAAGRLDEAAAAYRDAVALAPESALAHNNLGNVLARMGRGDEAAEQYRVALGIDAGFALPHNNLGNLLLQRGDLDGAAAAYRRALDRDPRHAEAHHNLGLVAFRLGRRQEAMAHYRAALAIAPDYADAHNDLGVACVEDGRVDDGIAHFVEALRSDPHATAPLENLAWALRSHAGGIVRNEDAIAAAESALAGGDRAGPSAAALREALAAYRVRPGDGAGR